MLQLRMFPGFLSTLSVQVVPRDTGSELSWWLETALAAPLWFIPMGVVLWLMGHTTQRHALDAEFARLRRGRWFCVLLGSWVASACAYAVLLAVR